MARVFLSHAGPDKPIVRRIAEALRAAGHEPWLDEERLAVGDSIPASVERGLAEADFVVLCLSREAAARGWVEAERDAALMQQLREKRARILPVRLEEVEPPYLIAQLAYVDLFTGEEAFRRGMERLARSIDAHVARDGGSRGRGAAPPPAPPPGPPAGGGSTGRPARGGPATILLLAANPSSETRRALDREVREIDQRLRGSEQRDAFRIDHAWAVRTSDLQACLLRYRPTIVHFSGQGSAAGELLLEDGAGRAAAVSTAALAGLFRVLGREIRCVVLNACFSEPQARAIAEHVDCVVGMSGAMRDDAAFAFAGAFYQALGFGEDAQTAFELGCSQIELAGISGGDVPRLLLREGVAARTLRFGEIGRP